MKLKVISVRYFETRRGVGYECKTNVRWISIWNDGNGGATFIDGNEHTDYYNKVREYNDKYNDHQLESLIDEFELRESEARCLLPNNPNNIL